MNNIPQLYFSKLMRAVVEFQLIEDGDRILIGISGGKDSIFLAYALAILQKRMKKKFSLCALTIDPQFTEDFPVARIASFCEEISIPFEAVSVNIAGTIEETPEKNPCFTCAFFRRGAINRYAQEHGCNKVAYAHHNDDAVETLLMGILYSGQIHTFTPKRILIAPASRSFVHSSISVNRKFVMRLLFTASALSPLHVRSMEQRCVRRSKS